MLQRDARGLVAGRSVGKGVYWLGMLGLVAGIAMEI